MERLNILFLTYCYPPQKFPRSIQISHLAQYLRNDFNITVITSESENNLDESLLNFTPLDNVIYSSKSKFTKTLERLKGYRIKKAVLPDFQYLWHFDLVKKAEKLIDDLSIDIIVTFGQPMSTHISGIKLKKKFPHLKWIAHFSDPWVDNLFNDYNIWIELVNKHYQNQVFRIADKLIFTSSETIDLVTKNYSSHIREKSICLPHCFNEALYSFKENGKNEKLIIRYIGNFYGNRQPDSFLKALQLLPHDQPALIRVEFIGSSTESVKDKIIDSKLEDIVFVYPSVNYIKSLELMNSADILLIIDAPAEESPFLPSKLIDYVGANKTIFGITPNGTSQKLIEEMGFLVADPRDIKDICTKLNQLVNNFSNNNSSTISNQIRDSYSVSNVGEVMKGILRDTSENNSH